MLTIPQIGIGINIVDRARVRLIKTLETWEMRGGGGVCTDKRNSVNTGGRDEVMLA